MSAVLDCLRHAAKRDAEKGGIGCRTTREVSDWTGLSLATARRHLWAAEEMGEVEAFDGGASGREGNPIEWRIVAAKLP